ncbi:hypothetical protein DFH05DRAFT_1486043 [Lentinula detonsa]|uniref:Small nuclear ribonucleoprotein Prp3 C-terminal domain-containing protein n=1 Tax=Lentinula detonsa TaxID=2804962 RepID=A0A9W8P4I6_9AGAR|nr:hypothetical protein DFH05DRAFT_1486043 [Lentinula detonsa]
MEPLLEELQLIECSLLPTEVFLFLEHCNGWAEALQSYASFGYSDSVEQLDLPLPSFHIGSKNCNVWFEVTLPLSTSEKQHQNLVSVKGENISRDQQENWQRIIKERLRDIGDSEYPIYQLFTSHLLPMLHEELDGKASDTLLAQGEVVSERSSSSILSNTIYHALFTSHHLVSPTKRRNLQQWSLSLSVSGFAKVGYPGVIYVEGTQENIEEFVDNVKAMQWLALRLRFMEPVLKEGGSGYDALGRPHWKEFQKVGDVMEEMRRIGREKFVLEIGIGSAGTFKG